MHKESVTNLLTSVLTHEQRLAKYITKNICLGGAMNRDVDINSTVR